MRNQLFFLTIATVIVCSMGSTKANAQCSASQNPVNEIVIRSGAGPCDGEQLRRNLGQALANAQVIAVGPPASSPHPGALAQTSRTPAQSALWRISQANNGAASAPVIVMPGMAGGR